MFRPTNTTGEITKLLRAAGKGDTAAEAELMGLVYDELRRLAHLQLRKERKNHTLLMTALVHYAYLRLTEQQSAGWQERSHLFAIAATRMRRILVNCAKLRNPLKRGGDHTQAVLDPSLVEALGFDEVDIIAFDVALASLAKRIVESRFFAGLTIKETAPATDSSPASLMRN